MSKMFIDPIYTVYLMELKTGTGLDFHIREKRDE